MRMLSLLALLTMFPGRLAARDLQVRLYTSRLPSRIMIEATQGQIQWRECATCPEKSGAAVAVEASGSELAITTENGRRVSDLYVSGAYILRPAGAPNFSSNFPLRIRATSGELLVIASVPGEDYVAGVLAAEGGNLENEEALKAMAIAIRTYAGRFPERHEKDGFDFCDDTHCQVFRWSGVDERIRSAVAATRGEILRYRGAPAATYYNQDCGGMVAAGKEAWPGVSEPYLTEHTDPYCAASGGLQWEAAISNEEIDRALRTAGISTPASWKTIEIAMRSPSGRAQRLKLAGGNPPSMFISASTLRFSVGRTLGWNKIRSDLYSVRTSGDRVLFSGRGSGHGVGLCQAGAREMGRQGKSYREILRFYYPGTELSAGPDSGHSETWQKRSSERFDLLSMEPDADSSILQTAERILKENEASIGWMLQFRVGLKIFPTLDQYRDTTGQPGWVAASTRGRTVRLQPIEELRRKGALESTLRHEFYHLLVEAHARENTPLWFREGLVLYLSDAHPLPDPLPSLKMEETESILRHRNSREELEKAYGAAEEQVELLIRQNGKQMVLDWLRTGVAGAVSAH